MVILGKETTAADNDNDKAVSNEPQGWVKCIPHQLQGAMAWGHY